MNDIPSGINRGRSPAVESVRVDPTYDPIEAQLSIATLVAFPVLSQNALRRLLF